MLTNIFKRASSSSGDYQPLLTQQQEAVNPDLSTLRKVPDSTSSSVWFIIISEICEKFAFYGLIGPFQNYIQHSNNNMLSSGGLGKSQRYIDWHLIGAGLGQAFATRILQSFILWCYITPIFWAIIADQYLGRLRTITFSAVFYITGLLILCASSLLYYMRMEYPFWGLLPVWC